MNLDFWSSSHTTPVLGSQTYAMMSAFLWYQAWNPGLHVHKARNLPIELHSSVPNIVSLLFSSKYLLTSLVISLTHEVAINVLFAFFLLGYEDHTKASGTWVTSGSLRFISCQCLLLSAGCCKVHPLPGLTSTCVCCLWNFMVGGSSFKIPTGRPFLLENTVLLPIPHFLFWTSSQKAIFSTTLFGTSTPMKLIFLWSYQRNTILLTSKHVLYIMVELPWQGFYWVLNFFSVIVVWEYTVWFSSFYSYTVYTGE